MCVIIQSHIIYIYGKFQIKDKIVIMTIADISSMSRYVSPINPAVFPHLSIVLLGIGLFFTAWFFVYEVKSCGIYQQNCN